MSTWKYCLLGDDGNTLMTNWQKVGDYYYFMYSNGTMAQSEWLKDTNNYWYYLDSTGQMLTGLQTINDNKYYLYEATDSSQGQYLGVMAVNCSVTVNGSKYTANDKGILISGFDSLVSDSLVDFVKEYESFYANAYYDGTGYTDAQLTIGYGTTKASVPDAFPDGTSSTCTEPQACEWLSEEINKMAKIVKADLDTKGVTLAQNEFDGLLSFAYNCGESALLGSTLYKNVVSGVRDSDTITSNFQAWSKASGQTLSGLLKRRNAEANIFLNGTYDSSH